MSRRGDLPRQYTQHAHGHVVKRLDGMLARCGGPSLCGQCKLEQSYLELLDNYRKATREVHFKRTGKLQPMPYEWD